MKVNIVQIETKFTITWNRYNISLREMLKMLYLFNIQSITKQAYIDYGILAKLETFMTFLISKIKNEVLYDKVYECFEFICDHGKI